MKRLTLVRHAKSSWSHPEIDDVARPLNKRGEKDAPLMGRRLAQRQMTPDCIISSPAKRAISTATILAKEIAFPIKEIVTYKDIYAANVAELIQVLQQIDDACNSVMLCGHNPGLTELSQCLTNYQIDKIPTCGIFCIDFAIDSWKELSQGMGTFVFFDYPKNPNA
jgi:phosphohistidine phosphatase